LTNPEHTALWRAVREATGQDVRRCQGCLDCQLDLLDGQDIALGSLMQMAAFDDEEMLSSRTLWLDASLLAARGACNQGLDIYKAMLSLRQEARRRGIRNELLG
jgi:hypothetical protein